MSNIIAFLVGLVSTVISWINQPNAPTAPVVPAPTPAVPKPKISNQSTGVALLLSRSMSLGPMPTTGGVIHLITEADANELMGYVIANANNYKLGLTTVAERIALLLAWQDSESRGDCKAIDPNEENWPKKPTDQDKLDNLDLGLAQFSWRTLIAMPDFKGMTPDEIKTQALDCEWSSSAMAAFCQDLVDQAKAAVLADASLLKRLPNGDVMMLAVESYNIGVAGATAMARKDGTKGNWAYATSVLEKFAKWSPLFL